MLTLIHAVAGRPWAIQAEIAFHVRGLLAKEGISGLRHLAELKSAIHGFDPQARDQQAAPRSVGTVAVVQVIGTLTQRPEAIGSAVTRSTADIAAEIRAAAVEPSVDAIVMDIHSPGGEVFGVPEAFASIRESAKMKPVVAFVNSMAGSAALYLASAASEIVVTTSGLIGSLGVYSLHVDASKALEQMGESWEFIVASKSPFKIEGNPAGPLTEDARADAQSRVDHYMSMFVGDVAKGRGLPVSRVEADFGGGRMLIPQDAVRVGMADAIGTFDQAIRRAADLSRAPRRGVRAEAPQAVPTAAADLAELSARATLAGVKVDG